MAGADDVRVVALTAAVLDVRGADRDAALALLLGVVDLVEGLGLAAEELGRGLGDRRGQGGLAVVDVPDGADVEVLDGHCLVLFSLCVLKNAVWVVVAVASTLSNPRR